MWEKFLPTLKPRLLIYKKWEQKSACFIIFLQSVKSIKSTDRFISRHDWIPFIWPFIWPHLSSWLYTSVWQCLVVTAVSRCGVHMHCSLMCLCTFSILGEIPGVLNQAEYCLVRQCSFYCSILLSPSPTSSASIKGPHYPAHCGTADSSSASLLDMQRCLVAAGLPRLPDWNL